MILTAKEIAMLSTLISAVIIIEMMILEKFPYLFRDQSYQYFKSTRHPNVMPMKNKDIILAIIPLLVFSYLVSPKFSHLTSAGSGADEIYTGCPLIKDFMPKNLAHLNGPTIL